MRGPYRCAKGQRAMKFEPLLTVEYAGPADLHCRFGDPEGRPTEGDAHTRHGPLIAAFVDVGQFLFVRRVLPHSQAQRIKRGGPPVVGLADRREMARDDVLEVHPVVLWGAGETRRDYWFICVPIC